MLRRRVTRVDPLSASRVFALLLFVQGFVLGALALGLRVAGMELPLPLTPPPGDSAALQALGALPPASGLVHSAALSQRRYLDEDFRDGEALFPTGSYDADLQQAAMFGQDHPAIAPPVGENAGVVHQIVAVLGREDARPRLVQ